MVRTTLEATKKATFAVVVPHPEPSFKEFPTPNGTGFFVSSVGHFVTARHVIQKLGVDGKPLLNTAGVPELQDMTKIAALQPSATFFQVTDFSLVYDFPQFDLVILKADFDKNKSKEPLAGKSGFDCVNVEFEVIPEGEPVYSFGYPLSEASVQPAAQPGGLMTGTQTYFPRATSLIIASHYDKVGYLIISSFPRYYVVDKALNYGNSGGPIVVESSGRVISVCTRFQPVMIKQAQGATMIPSLYGISVSLKNIESQIRSLKVAS